MTQTERLRRITVLIDDQKRDSIFYNCLNYKIGYEVNGENSTLTPYEIKTIEDKKQQNNINKLYLYETFNIFNRDKKLNRLYKSNDGLIIIIKAKYVNTDKWSRVLEIIDQYRDIPILIGIETNINEPINLPHIACPSAKWRIHVCLALSSDNVKQSLEWFYHQLISSSVREPFKPTSKNITSSEMLSQFENATLDMNIWDHYGRLRIVYLSLEHRGYKNTINPEGWLCTHWKKYKTSMGQGNLWNYSLIRMWTEIIHSLRQSGKYKAFVQLYIDNPQIHQDIMFLDYYSKDVIFTAKARNSWVPPNLKSLPISQINTKSGRPNSIGKYIKDRFFKKK